MKFLIRQSSGRRSGAPTAPALQRCATVLACPGSEPRAVKEVLGPMPHWATHPCRIKQTEHALLDGHPRRVHGLVRVRLPTRRCVVDVGARASASLGSPSTSCMGWSVAWLMAAFPGGVSRPLSSNAYGTPSGKRSATRAFVSRVGLDDRLCVRRLSRGRAWRWRSTNSALYSAGAPRDRHGARAA
jgi:hypothetical protein